MMDNNKNPWTSEDEREHFPSPMEWWSAITFFKTVEDNKKWTFKASFTEWCKKSKIMGCILNLSLLDREKNNHYIHFLRSNTEKFESAKDHFFIKYKDSFMKGRFPDYQMHFYYPKNNIELDLNFHAEAIPHWVTEDVTGGWLPMGLGFFRYGYIPKCNVTGTMKTENGFSTIKGKGYFEHVWGNFSYTNPLSNLSQLKKTFSTYAKLIGLWIHNHKPHIPKSIKFSTENNPLGYDWAWALFDNGWTLFYGNFLFWIMEGPIFGSLILSKDGRHYNEFCNVTFRYIKTEKSQHYDFHYPTELEITAVKGKEKISLQLKMTEDVREFISKFSGNKYWKALVVCEAPGTIKGYYFDGDKKTKLSGVCKIEPQRQVTAIGHNSLKLYFLKPPKGVGLDIDFNSHFLKKRINSRIQLAPHPCFMFKFKKY